MFSGFVLALSLIILGVIIATFNIEHGHHKEE